MDSYLHDLAAAGTDSLGLERAAREYEARQGAAHAAAVEREIERREAADRRAARAAKRPPAPKPTADEYMAQKIREVFADGGWKELLPMPIDGYVMVPHRSEPDADHRVQMSGRHVLYCTGPCNGHVTCFHRVKAALASWQEEHPEWDWLALCNQSGEPRTSTIHRLIDAYLTPPRGPFVKWWENESIDQPETPNALPEPVGEFV